MLNKIKADMKREETEREDLSKNEIVETLQSLYSHSLSGPRYFYCQDQNGWPLGKVSTVVTGSQIFPMFADRNSFSRQDWTSLPRPPGFTGPVWPPREVSRLTGSPQNTEHCCYCYDAGEDCADENNCNMHNYAEVCRNRQLARILLQPSPGRGYGLFAWEDIKKDKGIDQYAGKILPHKEGGPNGKYSTSIPIGLNVTDETKAYIDSTRLGSIYRFSNHSCNPNCELLEGRVGGHHRIMSVHTRRDIQEGEELTIDYGDDWFKDPKNPCLCGETNCRSHSKVAQGKPGGNKIRDGKGKKHGRELNEADDTSRPQTKRRR